MFTCFNNVFLNKAYDDATRLGHHFSQTRVVEAYHSTTIRAAISVRRRRVRNYVAGVDRPVQFQLLPNVLVRVN